MHLHIFQHVPFEGPAEIARWAALHGHSMSTTHFHRGEAVPPQHDYDWLVVLGGPMGVADEARHPWLVAERRFIAEAVAAGKTILGICLGAQLIARALGAAVKKNPCKEIGWFPIRRDPALADSFLGEVFPAEIEVFHWHGDTFDLPPGAIPVAASAACHNQGFILDERIVGFQFHLETRPEAAASLLEHCRADLEEAPTVQSAEEIMADPARFEAINRVLHDVLTRLASHPYPS